MSERQLDAYIQAREILRRLRALAAAPASLTAATRDGSPPLSRD